MLLPSLLKKKVMEEEKVDTVILQKEVEEKEYQHYPVKTVAEINELLLLSQGMNKGKVSQIWLYDKDIDSIILTFSSSLSTTALKDDDDVEDDSDKKENVVRVAPNFYYTTYHCRDTIQNSLREKKLGLKFVICCPQPPKREFLDDYNRQSGDINDDEKLLVYRLVHSSENNDGTK